MNETARTPSRPTMWEAIIRVFPYVSGPSLVAVLYTATLQASPALEVILASSVDFADGLSSGETWVQFYFKIGWRLFAVASVPAAVYVASRWVLRDTPLYETPAGHLLPRLFSILAFIGYLAALAEGLDLPRRCVAPIFGWAGIAGPSLVLTCQKAIITLVGTSMFFSFASLFLIGLFRILILDRRFGKPKGVWVVAAVIFVLFSIGVLFPTSGRLLGPLGIAAVFFSALAFGLAGLKLFSLHHLPPTLHQFPVIFVIVFLMFANASASVAPLAALLVVLMALVGVFRSGFISIRDARISPPASVFQRSAHALHCIGGGLIALGRAPVDLISHVFTWRRRQPIEIAGFAVVILCLGIWGLHLTTDACDSLSGCNRIVGVPSRALAVGDAPVSPASAYSGWTGRDESKTIIVAARGGGLFSAYHSAYYLAARADADPAFRRQLFAISGVSGGAVGSGVFWAVRESGICDRVDAAADCHRRAVDRILRRDYLSPLLARLFTLDTLDMVIPVSAALRLPIDRGAALETTINTSVNAWIGGAEGQLPVPRDALRRAMSDSWSGGSGLPLLFLNSTDVVTGELVLFSPVSHIRTPARLSDVSPALSAAARPANIVLSNGNDLSVVNAMVASARALAVTPAMRVVTRLEGEQVRRQLADGAPYDQSGIVTARDIVTEVQSVRDGEIELVLLEVPWRQLDRRKLANMLHAPATTYMATWRVRYQTERARLIEEAAQRRATGRSPLQVCTSSIQVSSDVARDFTVSWFLAQSTFDMIRDQIDGTENAPVANQGTSCW